MAAALWLHKTMCSTEAQLRAVIDQTKPDLDNGAQLVTHLLLCAAALQPPIGCIVGIVPVQHLDLV